MVKVLYHELKQSPNIQGGVSRVALKWGFNHIGQFSHYYTKLFGINPSETLKTDYKISSPIANSCIQRQEEIEL